MPDNGENARDRRFRTEFDGDEIDGKVYDLGAPVTGLDGPTGEYLRSTGRLIEIGEDEFARLLEEGPGEKVPADDDGESDEDREAREAAAKAYAERLSTVLAEVKAGNFPADLKGDKVGELASRDALDKLAAADGVTVKSSWQKAEVAAAIIIARQDKAAG